jgi:hypothetical protein
MPREPAATSRTAPDAQGGFAADCIGRDKLQVVARRHEGDAWVASKPFAPDEELVVQLEEGGVARVFVTSTARRQPARRQAARDSVTTRWAWCAASLSRWHSTSAGGGGGREPARERAREGLVARAGVRARPRAGGGEFQIDAAGEKVVRIQVVPGEGAKVTVLEDATSEPVHVRSGC